MHMLGKRHTRMAALHRQRGTPLAGVAAGLSAAVGGAPWPDAGAGGVSLQQQHHQQLMAAAAAAAAALNGGAGAAWVPSSSSGVRTAGTAASSTLDLASATTGHAGSGFSTPATGGAPASGSSAGAGTWAEEAAAAALQGLLLDAAGNQRIYRCDLCGVVTPSRRHYDYHLQVGGWGAAGGGRAPTGGCAPVRWVRRRLPRRSDGVLARPHASPLPPAARPQGIKHTRRLLRAQGLDPGSASQPGTPASCASPLAGSRSASPCTRGGRGRHSRHGSMEWAGGGGGGGGGRGEEPAPESLICSVCGIMATSAVNLEVRPAGLEEGLPVALEGCIWVGWAAVGAQRAAGRMEQARSRRAAQAWRGIEPARALAPPHAPPLHPRIHPPTGSLPGAAAPEERGAAAGAGGGRGGGRQRRAAAGRARAARAL